MGSCDGREVRDEPGNNDRVMESPWHGGEPWAGSREGTVRDRTLGRFWVELEAGHKGGTGEHCGAEALGRPVSQPQCLDPIGGHHPALLFTVHTALDGGEGPCPPQGAYLEGTTSTRRGCCPACPPTHAPVCQLCRGEGLRSRGRTPKAVLPGWMLSQGSKVLGDHTPKTEEVGSSPGVQW